MQWLIWQHASLLWLIPLIGIGLWWLERPQRDTGQWVLWGLRWLASSALVVALATPIIASQSDQIALMIVRDRSDSVDASARRQLDAVVQQIQQTQPANALVGIVDVAGDTRIAAAPQTPPLDVSYADLPNTADTALMQGLAQAAVHLPSGYIPRILVLSDGVETRGRLLDTLPTLLAQGVRVDAVVLSPMAIPPDAGIVQLTAPQSSRGQGDIPLTIEVASARPQPATLTILQDTQVISTVTILLEGTLQQFTVPLTLTDFGQQRITVRLDAPQDAQVDDNQRQLLLQRASPPRVLVLSADALRSRPFVEAAQRTGSQVTVARATDISARLVNLASYDAIVLVDTPADQVPIAVMQQIQVAVRDVGRGFIWIGGADSMGAGGYRRTPLAEMAAVSLDPQDPTKQQRMQLILVIDRSGSMDERVAGMSLLTLAKEGAYQAARSLRDGDAVAIAFFDDTAMWALPTTTTPDDDTLAQALGQVTPGNGTSIRAGLSLALQATQDVEADIRHVILLSDGIDEQSSLNLMAQFREQNMTLSTIALGSGADQAALAALAQRGGGEAYVISQPQQLPRIFLSDTMRVAGDDTVEGEFLAVVRDNADLPATLTEIPFLYGYNRTAAYPDTRVLWQIDAETPLWATRRVGRGVSMVWASDLGSRWARDYVMAGTVDQLVPVMLAQVLPSTSTDLDVRWYMHDDLLEIAVARAYESDTPPQLQLFAADGIPLQVELVAQGPQRWQAIVADLASGEYVLDVYDDVNQVTRGLIVETRRELSNNGTGSALLNEVVQQTGGQLLTTPADMAQYWQTTATATTTQSLQVWVILVAAVLFVIEIALRRLGWLRLGVSPRTWWPVRRRLQLPRPSTPAATSDVPPPTPPPLPPSHVDALRQARQRAREQIQSDTQRD